MDEATRPDVAADSGLQQLQAMLRDGGPVTGLFALLGFAPVLAERGRVVIAAFPDERHYNNGGTVHGGFAASLLDTVMGLSARSLLSVGQGVTTMEMKVSYHRPINAATGRIEAAGRVLSQGRRACFTDGQIIDSQGRLLASGTSTLLIKGE